MWNSLASSFAFRLLIGLFLYWIVVGSPKVYAQSPTVVLPRSTTPEELGVDSQKLVEFLKQANRDIDSLHSFMLVRHGSVVMEAWWNPYTSKDRHELYSLSKSFTSTAVGLAIAEGKLSLDDEVSKFFPEDMPSSPSNQLKSMRVRDLLRMATGHDSEPKLGKDDVWTKTFLAHPVTFKPGTHFLYNTPATYMLSAIVQKQTGEPLLSYLQPRLFQPLGIENPTWGTSPQGVSLGGYGLSVRTEDIAKFGLLYLEEGKWNGKQLLPSHWVNAATSLQVSNGSSPTSDWDQGYGFQFWRCRHGFYRGDGAFGQYCIVMPELDAVVAITSGVKDMQQVLNIVWDRVVPALASAPALPENKEANQRLTRAITDLEIPRPKAEANLPKIDLAGKKFTMDKNEQQLETIEFRKLSESELEIAITQSGKTQTLTFPFQGWKRARYALDNGKEQDVGLCVSRTDATTWNARVCLVETPFVIHWELKVDSDQLKFHSKSNVGFANVDRGAVLGKLAK